MTIEDIPNRKHKNIMPCIERVRKLYKHRGFRVRFLLTDNEFEGMREMLSDVRIKLNTTVKNEHVPQVERGIRVLEERGRASLASLPFKIIPRILQRDLIKREVTWINMFPRKGGISQKLSPRTRF